MAEVAAVETAPRDTCKIAVREQKKKQHTITHRFQHDTGPLDKGHIYGSLEKHRKIGGTGHEKTRRPAIHVVLGRYEPKAGKEPKKPEKCTRDTETERWRLKKKQREDKSERSDCDVAACVVVGVDDADLGSIRSGNLGSADRSENEKWSAERLPERLVHFHATSNLSKQSVLQKARDAAKESYGYDTAKTRADMATNFLARFGRDAYPWQLDVSKAFILNVDGVVIAGTGAGKTIPFMLPLLINPMTLSWIFPCIRASGSKSESSEEASKDNALSESSRKVVSMAE
ncbi:hypothetical protein C8R45DRAFT_1133833 [Mycena sanguinolenta]|nr:hypothetical protein C8R45DRAFT_1133833 [Mycena sanguinolenta]